MVIPVGLRADDGQLLLTVGAAKVSGLLVGQVVALTVGRNARRFRQGWSVTAHGRLGNTLPDGSLPLEIAHLEGVTVAHPPRRRMS